MAGEWIKMRTSLLTNPKVNGIARIIEQSPSVGRVLSTGFNGSLREIVTRNVTRHVTVSSLLIIWGAANEHTKDGIFRNADLSDIDDMVGVPGFGAAMVEVGWAEFDEEANCVTLPNFIEYNTTGEERSARAKTPAERQKEYRDRKKQEESYETVTVSDVTNDVTRNRREEKNREEKSTPTSSAPEAGISASNPELELVPSAAPADADDVRRCPVGTLVDLYHDLMPNNPRVKVLNEARKKAIRARWIEASSLQAKPFGYTTRSQGLEAWRQFFEVCAESAFLTGRAAATPGKPAFVADIDFIFSPAGFVKTLENKYHRDTA